MARFSIWKVGAMMNYEYEFQYGYSGRGDWEHITVISAYFLFYDMLTENGVNVVQWNTAQKLLTYAEIDDEYLPTGRVFQLISSRKTNLPETGGFNP